MTNIANDPNVQAALTAVGADQSTLIADLATQATAATALAAATAAKAQADSTVAADQSHLQTDVLALYTAIQTSTGVAPPAPAPAPVPMPAS